MVEVLTEVIKGLPEWYFVIAALILLFIFVFSGWWLGELSETMLLI
jgi:hypothetical protein